MDLTNSFVYGELRHEIQHVVNVFVRSYGNSVLLPGNYMVKDLYRMYRKDDKFCELWDAALKLAYPRDGWWTEIKVEYGSFRCTVTAHGLLEIGMKFEKLTPKKQRGSAICADIEYCREAA